MIQEIKKIRDQTGKPLVECKAAYMKANGDTAKALIILAAGEKDKKLVPGGYRFDSWANSLGKAIVSGIKKGLADPSGLEEVVIELDDMSYWPMFVTVTDKKGRFQFQPYGNWDSDSFNIPEDADQKDPVLASFLAQFISVPSFSPAAFSLGDYFKLPGSIWRYTLIQLEELVKERSILELNLAKDEFNCIVQVSGEIISKEKSMIIDLIVNALKKELSDQAMLKAFAEICYEETSSQKWLVSLA